jgi:hypothetical protein
VVVTAGVVAIGSHGFGLAWGPPWVIGADSGTSSTQHGVVDDVAVAWADHGGAVVSEQGPSKCRVRGDALQAGPVVVAVLVGAQGGQVILVRRGDPR